MLLRSMAGSMSGSSPHSSPHQAEHDVEILIATFLRRIHSASCTTNWGIARLPMPLPQPLPLPLPACLTGYWHCPGLFGALLLLLLALMLFGRHLIYGKCSRWQAAKHFQLNDCILAPCGKLSSVHTHTHHQDIDLYIFISNTSYVNARADSAPADLENSLGKHLLACPAFCFCCTLHKFN